MGPGTCLHEIFTDTARRFPDRVAVTASGVAMSYRELDRLSDVFASHLRAVGIGPDDLVGLCAEPGPHLVAGMLGVLKAGGAYLPVDPAYPDDRMHLLLEDSGAVLVLADAIGRDRLRDMDVRVLVMGEPETGDRTLDESGVTEDNLAYVIYTSGSTGRPKGVEIEHHSVVRLFEETAGWFGFDENDVWLMAHSPSFDFSVWEIWGALLHGGRLVIPPAHLVRAPLDLWRLLRDEQVTVLSQTPSAFRLLLATESMLGLADLPPLRYVVFGGERLDPVMLGSWATRHGLDRPQLVNMYGITETTVHVTYRRITREDLSEPGRSPIGVPIPDLLVTVRGPDGALTEDGTPGEMWIGGPGVARGYRHRPDLTAERFVRTDDGVRAYRSGDLAVRSAGTGELFHLGRADDQIKVRGYRIEPFEVETSLTQHTAVTAAIVDGADLGDGDQHLVAFVQPAAPAGDEEELTAMLRKHMNEHLPAHLRPSVYRFVPEIPLTPQGKADRAAFRQQPAGAVLAAPVGKNS